MKKLLPLVALFAVLAVAVAGCKSEQKPIETPDTPTPEMPDTNAPAAY